MMKAKITLAKEFMALLLNISVVQCMAAFMNLTT